jgi:hypothetical protein
MTRALRCALGLLAVSAVLGPTAAVAQLPLTVSVGGGLQATSFWGAGADVPGWEQSSRAGFHVGASASMPVAGRFGVEAGAFYARKGGRYWSQGPGVSRNLDRYYILVPVTASVRLNAEDSPAVVSIFAGPEVSFEVNCYIVTDPGPNASCPDADDDNRRTTDIGAIGGMNVVFPVSDLVSLQLSAGADLGVLDLVTSPNAPTVRNRAFFATAAIGFNLGEM